MILKIREILDRLQIQLVNYLNQRLPLNKQNDWEFYVLEKQKQ